MNGTTYAKLSSSLSSAPTDCVGPFGRGGGRGLLLLRRVLRDGQVAVGALAAASREQPEPRRDGVQERALRRARAPRPRWGAFFASAIVVNGLNRYVNDPWVAVTDMVISRP